MPALSKKTSMKTLHLTVKSCGRHFFAVWLLLLPAIAIAAEPANDQPARDPSACELKIVGRHVEKLTLADEEGQLTEIDQPGPSVFLPPGRYLIKEISLKWDDTGRIYTDKDVNCINLEPGKTRTLSVGEMFKLSAERMGNRISLDYNLREQPTLITKVQSLPELAIYQGKEKIAAGTLKYG
jgi:hypothetical protein